MLYAFFWVIPRRLNFICRRFRTLCLFHLYRQVGACRMNWLGTCLGYYMGKGLAWKWSEPLGRRGAEFIPHATTCLRRWNRQSVPKRRHIKFRRRGITQKKAYNKKLATFSSDVASNEKYGGSRSQPVLFDCAHWRTHFETNKMNVYLAECTEIKQ